MITEDALDSIREVFYETVLEQDAKGRQIVKRATVKSLTTAGMAQDEATAKVQRWFVDIREQQKERRD